jgi:hypothetical protein
LLISFEGYIVERPGQEIFDFSAQDRPTPPELRVFAINNLVGLATINKK